MDNNIKREEYLKQIGVLESMIKKVKFLRDKHYAHKDNIPPITDDQLLKFDVCEKLIDIAKKYYERFANISDLNYVKKDFDNTTIFSGICINNIYEMYRNSIKPPLTSR